MSVSTASVGGTPRRRPRTVLDPDERRREIVSAAHRVYLRKGVAATTVTDISKEAGVTRGLVYHYFATTDEIADVVLDRYVDSFVDQVREWDSQRRLGHVDQAVHDIVALFRRALADPELLRLDLLSVGNAALYQRFVDRAVGAVVDVLQVTTVQDYARRHDIEIRHVRETFVVLLHGVLGLLRTQPDIDEQVLVDIFRQTLRLPVTPDPVPDDRTRPTSDPDPTDQTDARPVVRHDTEE